MVKAPQNNKPPIVLILLSITWVALLFAESSRAPAEIFGKVPGLDKVAHFIAFGILECIICVIWFNVYGKQRISLLSLPFLMVVLIGFVEEGYQATVPGRAASGWDLLADMCGAAASVFFLNLFAKLEKLHR